MNAGVSKVAEARTVNAHRRKVLDRIYRAFESLIDAGGYDAVNLADIARAAKMARTAIYHYFPDKESLLLAYTAHEMDEFFSDLRAELHGIDDPRDRLDAYVRAHLRYFVGHHMPPGPALRSVLSEAGYRTMQSHAEILEATLSAILAEAAADGSVSTAVLRDPHTVRLILGCVSSAPWKNVRGPAFDALAESTQAFVRRAVGVDGTGPA